MKLFTTIALAALSVAIFASASPSSLNCLRSDSRVEQKAAGDSSSSARSGSSSSSHLRKARPSTAKHDHATLGRHLGHHHAKVSAISTATSSPSSSSRSTGASRDSSLPSVIRGTVTGHGTFYYQDGVAGSCGTKSSDQDKVVAVKEGVMQSSLCGKTVVITNNANGMSVTAKIMDTCPGCNSDTALDLSVAAFTSIGNETTGVLDISWHVSD